MEVLDSPIKIDRASTVGGVERKLNRVCDQMELLHMKIAELQSRAADAEQHGRWSHCSSLGMRLSMLQGVYNMYYEFAARTSRTLCQLHVLQQHSKGDQS